jgi:hypothetical protein
MVYFENAFRRSFFHHNITLHFWKNDGDKKLVALFDPKLLAFAASESRDLIYSAFGKSLCTYKRSCKWCPRASIQARTRLISSANTFCRSACEMFLMSVVIAVFNSLSVCGRSRYPYSQIFVPEPKCTATFRTHCTYVTVRK